VALKRHSALRVNQAIDRGVAYLKSLKIHPDPENSALSGATGYHALVGLTLLECGEAADSEAVLRAAERVRAIDAAPRLKNYDVTLSLLFLCRLGLDEDHDRIRLLTARLIAAQTDRGGWDYAVPPLKAEQAETVLKSLETSPLTETVLALKALDPKPPVFAWRRGAALPATTTPEASLASDNSNTQFAILALWAVRKYGLPVERSLLMAEAHFRATQNDDGSWAYRTPPAPRTHRNDSMTCAGLLALAVGRALDAERARADRGDDPGVRKGFAFLANRVRTLSDPDRPKPTEPKSSDRGKLLPSNAWGDLYFLWSLERVGVLFDVRTVGEVDWYAWGSELLVESQQADGSWADAFPGTADTCFALLFLKRVNVAQTLTAELKAQGPLLIEGSK
jgi:hypothetical protein